jgi:hypothetical protein
MSRDGRAAVRQKERTKVVITGIDATGLAFEEKTEAYDISEEGVSFYLSRPLWINSHLTTEVVSSSLFAASHVTRAMVVQIQ